MNKLLRLLAVCLMGAFATCSIASPRVFETVDYPGAVATYPVAIVGDVIVGNYLDANSVSHGFALSEGAFTSVDVPDAGSGARQGTFPIGMSKDMAIAGSYIDSNNVTHGFSRSRAGAITHIDIPGAISQYIPPIGGIPLPVMGAAGTQVNGINEVGQIVGSYRTSPYPEFGFLRGFLWSQGGEITLIDIPGVEFFTVPSAINEKGEIVGGASSTPFVHPFYRSSNGEFTSFDVPGALAGISAGINGKSEVVGIYFDGKFQTHGFYRSSRGQITTIDPPGSVLTVFIAISEKGVIVGSYLDANNVYHGFSHSRDGAFTQIDIPGAANTKYGGTSVNAIGEEREIAGNYTDVTGKVHGFVWKRSP